MFQPFGNTTELPPTQWHPEPQYRGTFSILSSCLITMSLCIWTSLHLNLPEHKKGYQQTYEKAIWMILGLLTPELVVWKAWDQSRAVKELNALMEEKGFMPRRLSMRRRARTWSIMAWSYIKAFFSRKAEDLPDFIEHKPYTQLDKHRHPWTNVHSWFVIMGGIAFEDLSPGNRRFLRGTRQRVTLTHEGFVWMVTHRPHLVPNISVEHILDKSKSDWLAKGLTCWQAGYFCILCVFRLSQRLSITLLELNVFAHAICALLIFLIWWDKPRDVHEPTLLSDEESLDICACMEYAYSSLSPSGFGGRLKFVHDSPVLDGCFEITGPTTITVLRVHPLEDSSGTKPNYAEHDFFIMSDFQRFRFLKAGSAYYQIKGWDSRPHMVRLTINDRIIANLVRISRTMEQTPTLMHSMHKVKHHRYTSENIPDWSPAERRSPDANATASWSELYQPNRIRLMAGTTFAGLCYGGLHLTAWAACFRSHAEALIWRAAAITILATGPGFALLTIVIVVTGKSADSPLRPGILLRYVEYSFIMFLLIVMLLLLVWCVLCRIFIVVECFILLAHIPESASRVPTWAAYVPSFS